MFGLSFLSPWFLLGALGVALPILLHLRRKDTAPQHAFSAVRFLRRAPFEQRRPKKLRDLLLLALRAAALLLLALAFARPYFAAGQTAGPTTVVAVDTSFSMGAPEVFGRAREAAGRAVSKAPAGSRIAVVRFDDYAAVLAPPSLDRGSARAAIGSLASGAGGTEYGAMLAVATRLLGATGGRLVVVTDLQRAAWTGAAAGALPEGVDLEVVDVGAPLENLAVTSVRREGDAVVAQITNHGFAARSSRVELSLNDSIDCRRARRRRAGAHRSRFTGRPPAIERSAARQRRGCGRFSGRQRAIPGARSPASAGGAHSGGRGDGRRRLLFADGHRVGRPGAAFRPRGARGRPAQRAHGGDGA